MDFVIPDRPEALLEDGRDANRLYVRDHQDITALAPQAVHELAERLAFELCENDTLCVVEQNLFDQLYSLTSGWGSMPTGARTLLVDTLASNLAVLVGSCMALKSDSPAVDAHRAALKTYAYFLSWLVSLNEADAKTQGPVAAPEPAKGKGGKKAAKAAVAPAVWDWSLHRQKVGRPLEMCLELNFDLLFRGRAVEEDFLQIFIRVAFMWLECPIAMKAAAVKSSTINLLGRTAMNFPRMMEAVTSGLVDRVNKLEHLPAVVADLAHDIAERYQDGKLAVMLLREVGGVDPAHYKRQQERDAAGVRNVANFLSDLSAVLPKLVATNISSVVPHLEGESYPMRNAVVTVLGNVLARALNDEPEHDHGNTNQLTTHLRTKQAILDTLVMRMRDVSAYTRARVLQTWAMLVQEKAVPLGHWLVVAEIAAGRLEDKASVVRKDAARLLGTMMMFNPFSGSLATGPIEASLQQYLAKLPPPTPSKDIFEGETQIVEEDDEDDEGTEAEVPETPTKPVPDAAAEGEGVEATPSQAPPDSQETPALDGGVEALRALVASLTTARDFAALLAKAMRPITNLLASGTSTDVVEAVDMVVMAHQFNVDGAPAAVQRMLALVFSREPTVKEKVVDACVGLWLDKREKPRVAAGRLLQVAAGASLGTLAALEQLISQLVLKDLLPAKGAVVRALWALLGEAATPVTDKRAALTVLGMAAAVAPEVVRFQLATLLEVGFGAAAAAGPDDPLARRAVCVALAHLAPQAGRQLGPAALPADSPAFTALRRVLVGTPAATHAWFTVAEQAVAAVYATHPDPESFVLRVLQSLYERALPDDGEAALKEVDEGALARLLFVVAHVALKTVVYAEGLVKAVRRRRVEQERQAAAATEAPGAPSAEEEEEEEEGIEAATGGAQGAMAQEAELDAVREATERAMLQGCDSVAPGSGRLPPVAAFAPLVVAVCSNRPLLAAHPTLRGAAVLALTKLMAIDAAFCEQHLQLLFTLLRDAHAWDATLRSNILIALGDLAFRFPNALEPWTQHLYGSRESGSCLHDTDDQVRHDALLVLTHLILNDMMKVKGHISEMVLRLEDADPRIRNLAKLFVHELARKPGNVVYNLLPDLISRLSADPLVAPASFQRLMSLLLSFVDKERQADSLLERLTTRFVGADNVQVWRDISFCMALLPVSERSVKKLAENWKSYAHTLTDDQTAKSFVDICHRAKRSASPKASGAEGGGGGKAAADALEARIAEVRLEQSEAQAEAESAEAAEPADEEEAAEAPVSEETEAAAGEEEDATQQEEEEEEDAENLPPTNAKTRKGKSEKATAERGKAATKTSRTAKAVAAAEPDSSSTRRSSRAARLR